MNTAGREQQQQQQQYYHLCNSRSLVDTVVAGRGALRVGVLVRTVVGEWAAEGAASLALPRTSAAVGFGSAGAGLSALSRPMEVRS